MQKELFGERYFLLWRRWINKLEPVTPDVFHDPIARSASVTRKFPSREWRPTLGLFNCFSSYYRKGCKKCVWQTALVWSSTWETDNFFLLGSFISHLLWSQPFGFSSLTSPKVKSEIISFAHRACQIVPLSFLSFIPQNSQAGDTNKVLWSKFDYFIQSYVQIISFNLIESPYQLFANGMVPSINSS